MTSDRSYIDGYDTMQHWWYWLLNDSDALRVVALVLRCGGTYTGTREQIARECGCGGEKMLRRWLQAVQKAGFIEVRRGLNQCSYTLSDAYVNGTLEQQARQLYNGLKGPLRNGPKGPLRNGPKGQAEQPKRAIPFHINNKSNKSNGTIGSPETGEPDTTGIYLQAWCDGYKQATGRTYTPTYSVTSDIRDLTANIRTFLRQQHQERGLSPPDDTMVADTLTLYVIKAYECGDSFVRRNFELKLLVNHFNSLITNVLNHEIITDTDQYADSYTYDGTQADEPAPDVSDLR